MTKEAIIGFDSAWTDKASAPGAICIISRRNGRWTFKPPRLTTFGQALTAIQAESEHDYRLVAIDQPTIVPNACGSRPVDKIAASVISFVGGGVQPANRSKLGMFDDAAPIWKFKQALDAIEDPEQARAADKGLFVMEVFPALALPSVEPRLYARYGAARYNPANRKRYRHQDWLTVVDAVDRWADELQVGGAAEWCHSHRHLPTPRKGDQDLLDAVICALIGLTWRVRPRDSSLMIGDLKAGYMITPVSSEVRTRLVSAASYRGVEFR